MEVDGHSDLVARRHHLHWRILQESREAYLRQGSVSERSGRPLQLESRRKSTPRDRHSRRRRGRRWRVQGAREGCGGPQWREEEAVVKGPLRDASLNRLFLLARYRSDELATLKVGVRSSGSAAMASSGCGIGM